MRGLSIPCWLVALFSVQVAVALLTSHKPIHVGTRQRRGKLMKRNMFSGIVEVCKSLFVMQRENCQSFMCCVQDIGEVVDLKVNPAMKMWDGSLSDGVELTVRSTKAVEEAYIGCSIAVNGVCLTATSYDHEQVRHSCMPSHPSKRSVVTIKKTSVFGTVVYRWIGTRDTATIKFGQLDPWKVNVRPRPFLTP